MSASQERKPIDPVVLIVEDNRVNQLLLLKKFETRGWTAVRLAGTGRQALDLALETSPDLVLMDIQLPDMNGNAVIKKLRDGGFRGRIVVLSADTGAEDVANSLAAGADGFIGKPIDFTVFFERINGFLRRPGGAPPPPGTGGASPDDMAGRGMDMMAADVSPAARSVFISDGKDKLLILADALAHAGDPEHMARIRAIAHEYKGSAGYFGLKELAGVARELDMGFSEQEAEPRLLALARRLHDVVQAVIDGNERH
jgi:DNA-binding response OmpR family regulator